MSPNSFSTSARSPLISSESPVRAGPEPLVDLSSDKYVSVRLRYPQLKVSSVNSPFPARIQFRCLYVKICGVCVANPSRVVFQLHSARFSASEVIVVRFIDGCVEVEPYTSSPLFCPSTWISINIVFVD